ncbi:FdhD protein [Microbulbifer donghaiensis]|uniref:Sulfur carrier protein FdhD n=1 Tax=Microbulbifer donghaiensis TaxID=494016 RepID=A0A1M4V3F4_9GAMM|nr:formate dehydrogenase accessory sulfurtransferase FdhD [Microbulbifer donghaiensis]SHE63521.1 FdhD protein [Microbulbifer donghaiensis]
MPATLTRTPAAPLIDTETAGVPCAAEAGFSILTERDTAEPGPLGFQPLATEAAVAISYDGMSHAVMMATPADLEDYAVGFSIGNGIVESATQILDIRVHRDGDAVHLDIRLNHRAHHGFKQLRRTLAGNSGCGLCGVQALAQVLSPLRGKRGGDVHAPLPPPVHLSALRERIHRAQRHRQRSGAMHAALYIGPGGDTQLCREDIGRHNAMDKLLGACLRQQIPLAHGFVAVTSRCSLELVQKAVRAGVGTLVSLSAPTDMCVRWARANHLNLLHQPAQAPARLYSPLAAPVKELL